MSTKALPKGSRVLVTGANGYIASHVADQLMSLGYTVRGTARDQQKVDSIGKTLKERNPSATFEGFVLSDVTALGAFDKAVADCDGVIHLATDVSFSPDPNEVVSKTLHGMRSILEAAAKTPSIKRFVYTSSSIAAVHPTPNVKFHVDSNSWNEIDLKDAWAPPPYTPERSFAVYGASKVEAEREGWKFVETEKPGFVFNTVLPNFAVGPLLNSDQFGSTSGWIRGLYEGNQELTERVRTFPPQYSVDVRDVARTHVAALLESDVQNERLFAFAEPFNYSRVVDILKKIDSSKQNYPAPIENEGRDLSTVANERVVELLQRARNSGFIGLEESLRDQLQG